MWSALAMPFRTHRLSWHTNGKTRLTPEERQRSPGLGQKRGIRRPESVFLHLCFVPVHSSWLQKLAKNHNTNSMRRSVCVCAHTRKSNPYSCMCEQWHQFLLNLKCVGYSCSHEYMAIAVAFLPSLRGQSNGIHKVDIQLCTHNQ